MVAGSALFWVLIVTGAALMATAVALYLRDRRKPHETPDVPGGDHEILIYLNETMVMDILQYRGNVPALKQQVESYTRDSAEGRAEAKSRWFSFSGGRTREGETTKSFEVVEQPITAIRKVVRELEAADAIVYADLHQGEVHAHRSLVGKAGEAILSGTEMFLSVTGVFETYEEDDGSNEDFLSLRAPYPGGGAHVRITIARSGLRQNEVKPDRHIRFRGRLLGKVESWDAETRTLKMWALAIFR